MNAVRYGLSAVARNWGLVLLLLLVNVLVAGALAVPLAGQVETELRNKDAGTRMTYGFDYNWWSEWHDRQHGWTSTFSPEVLSRPPPQNGGHGAGRSPSGGGGSLPPIRSSLPPTSHSPALEKRKRRGCERDFFLVN